MQILDYKLYEFNPMVLCFFDAFALSQVYDRYINCTMLKVLIAKRDSKWESHADDKLLKKQRINSIWTV